MRPSISHILKNLLEIDSQTKHSHIQHFPQIGCKSSLKLFLSQYMVSERGCLTCQIILTVKLRRSKYCKNCISFYFIWILQPCYQNVGSLMFKTFIGMTVQFSSQTHYINITEQKTFLYHYILFIYLCTYLYNCINYKKHISMGNRVENLK